MLVSDFDFQLPLELLAQAPLAERSASRLLCLDRQTGDVQHQQFRQLLDYLEPGDLLVFNNTRVIPARLYGHKATGGKIELLLERILTEQRAVVHIKASRAPQAGTVLVFAEDITAEVIERQGDLFVLDFAGQRSVLDILTAIGSVPLPPYITRTPDADDKQRYQTVYAEHDGAVAAPTAGLHFDKPLLQQLQQSGVEFAYVTLHVGAGTFQSMRVEQLSDHVMHSEYMVLDEQVCQQVMATKAAGKRVIAVGTTSVRCLESAAKTGQISPYCGDTALFIYPGYEFKVVDAMVTNFHLPQSTLLMLVSAFTSRATMLAAYQQAIAERYRFFSYGDAMFIY